MNRIKVQPINPDAVMHDPTTGRRLPPEGMWVADHHFWRRRERDREIRILDEPDPDAPSSSSRATPTGLEPVTPITTR